MNKKNNKKDPVLAAVGMSSADYNTLKEVDVDSLVGLNQKYRELELRILSERAFSFKKLSNVNKRLNVYELGYQHTAHAFLLIAFVIGIVCALFYADQVVNVPYYVVACAFFGALLNLGLIGRTYVLMGFGNQRMKKLDDESKKASMDDILEFFPKAESEETGEYVLILTIARRILETEANVRIILKDLKYTIKRDYALCLPLQDNDKIVDVSLSDSENQATGTSSEFVPNYLPCPMPEKSPLVMDIDSLADCSVEEASATNLNGIDDL